LRRGEVVDQGTHDELLERCELYRRIFARYEDFEPPSVAVEERRAVGRQEAASWAS
jgi:ATP-binding cassette subfamily B protein